MADETRRLIRVRTLKGATFRRDGYGKKKQLSASWRKPRGQHNKQREQKKAKGALPKPGFGSPIAVRGMHPSGFFEVLVHTIDDLAGLDPGTQAIRIASGVGKRKRAALQEKAIAAGLKVLNAKAVQAAPKAVPAAESAEKPREKKEQKEKKQQPAVNEKPPAPKKSEGAKAKKEPKTSSKPPAAKKVKEPEEAAPAEGTKKKEQKDKTPKAKAEAAAGDKPRKAAKPKTAPKAKEESKASGKPAPKTATKARKKSSKGVKDNE